MKWKITGLWDEKSKRTIWHVYDPHTLRFLCKTWDIALATITKHYKHKD